MFKELKVLCLHGQQVVADLKAKVSQSLTNLILELLHIKPSSQPALSKSKFLEILTACSYKILHILTRLNQITWIEFFCAR